MKVIRTSSKKGTSYNDFQWPKSGFVEAPDWDPMPICGLGLHGLHIEGGDPHYLVRYFSFTDCLWQVVEVQSKDVIDLDGKVKFPRGNVIFSGDVQGAFEAWLEMGTDEVRQWICKDPKWAYWFAHRIDKGPKEDTRNACLGSPQWSYTYAYHVDKGSRDDTRNATLGSYQWAYNYALMVDKGPRDDTRKAVHIEAAYARAYATFIDTKPHETK